MSAADIVRAAVPHASLPTSGAVGVSGSTVRDLVQASAERFSRITAMAERLLRVEAAAIDLQDGERLWPPFEQNRTPALSAAIPTTAGIDDLVAVPDVLLDERFAGSAIALGRHGAVRSYAAAALRGAGGGPVGTLSVAGSAPRPFTTDDLRTLCELARWAEEELQLASELARSAQVQRSMLPASLVFLPGWEVAGRCSPVRAVAGDFYDWYPVRGGAAITLADVMGKGMPAA